MKEFIIKSKYDDLELSCLLAKPKGKAKGIVQISHGMTEHKERYIPFIKYLTSNGYIVMIHDHRGHGKSIKTEDDLGYFYDQTATAIVEDLHEITHYLKEQFPNLPIYLLGHSMGSMVVREYIKKYDQDITKLIICGSPSKNYAAGLAIMLVKLLIKIKGDRYRSKFINETTFGDFNNNIKNSKSFNSWLCSDEEVVAAYDEDELCGYIFTLNGFLNLFKLNNNIYKKKNYLVKNQDLPIYFIAGANDPVIGDKDAWEESIAFLKNIGYHNISSNLYKNLRHEILLEKTNEKVYQDILKFIEQ